MANPRLNEIQNKDLEYIKGCLEDVLNGGLDDIQNNIRALENISRGCSYIAGELIGI